MAARKQERWVQVSVEADRDAIDDLVRLFERHCTGGAVVEDYLGRGAQQAAPERVIVKGFLPVDDEETRQKLEVALLLLSRTGPTSEPQTTVLEPEDWAETWKAGFAPQQIGQRTVIVPSWHTYTPRPGDVIVHLDPGMAFGTGLHSTTRLVLAALEKVIRPGARVLDVGTGSGILAVAAAHQGAAEVLALDMDPQAVEVAQENVVLNGVGDVVRVAQGTVRPGGVEVEGALQGGTYDLVLANILAEVIIAMAEGLARSLVPGGTLVSSGILRTKADEVAAALSRAGVTTEERPVEGDWIALLGRRIP